MITTILINFYNNLEYVILDFVKKINNKEKIEEKVYFVKIKKLLKE